MFLKQITSRDYGIVHGTWPASLARQYLELIRPKRVLVAVDTSGKNYCFFKPKELLELLSDPDATVFDTPGVNRPVLAQGSEYDDADTSPDQAVVFDQSGRLLGFSDIDFLPSERVRGVGSQSSSAVRPTPFILRTEYPREMGLNEGFEFKACLEKIMAQNEAMALKPGSEIWLEIQPKEGIAVIGARSHALLLPGALDVETKSRFVRFELLGERPGVCSFYLIVRAENFEKPFFFECQILEHRQANRTPSREISRIYAPETRPDLTLTIYSESHNNQCSMRIVPNAQIDDPKMRGIYKLSSMDECHRKLFATDYLGYIDEIKTSQSPEKWATSRLRLENACVNLTEQLIPIDLQQRLWDLQDRISTVFIRTEDLDIPWELCRLCPPDKSRAFYFAEKWGMTRWNLDEGPPLTLSLESVALISPANGGHGAIQESGALEKIFKGSVYRPSRPTFMNLMESLKEDVYDCWHFSGHVDTHPTRPDFSMLVLDEEPPFCQLDLSTLDFKNRKPLIFLNGCNSGLIRDAGAKDWSKRFVQMGAAAFIGSLWHIKDHYPSYFALAFYKSLLDGATISQAALAGRKAAKDTTGETTWLSYCVYANPMAVVKQPSMEKKLFS